MGPVARKFICSRCEVYRWVEQFGGRSASILDADSVCDLCVMREGMESRIAALEESMMSRFSALQSELEVTMTVRVSSLQAELEAALGKIATLEANNCVCSGRDKLETARTTAGEEKVPRVAPTAVAVESAVKCTKRTRSSRRRKKNRNKTQRQKEKVEEIKKPEKNALEKIEIKRKSKLEKKKPDAKAQKKISAGRVTVIGDSQTRGLQSLLTSRLHTEVKVRCLPGRGNAAIRAEVEKAPLNKSSLVAICVSGNDLYLRNFREGSTEPVLKEVMGTVDDAGLKTSKRLVVGMIPRRGPYPSARSKNVSINQRLSDLCVAEGVLFADPYPHFHGRNEFYQWDGTHLSVRGKIEYANFVADAIKRANRITHSEVRSRKTSYPKVTPDRTFSSVLRESSPTTPMSVSSQNGEVSQRTTTGRSQNRPRQMPSSGNGET